MAKEKNNTDLGVITFDAFTALMLHDEKMVGTPAYLGIAYFWHHEYRIPMRDISYASRRRIHHAMLSAGLPLDGESRRHQKLIDDNLNAADERRLRECYG